MDYLAIGSLIAAGLIIVFYKFLEKKAKSTPTVLDDKILTLVKAWADKIWKTKI